MPSEFTPHFFYFVVFVVLFEKDGRCVILGPVVPADSKVVVAGRGRMQLGRLLAAICRRGYGLSNLRSAKLRD